MMAEVGPLATDVATPKLQPVAQDKAPTTSPAAVKEKADIARSRAARATMGGKTYRLVHGEQEDGELAWLSPMWITYKP